jgi:acetyltransferase-like isoleucine patch superfamily enzyme
MAKTQNADSGKSAVGSKKSILRRVTNRILHQFARVLPGATSIRPFLHGLRGVQIHGSVFIGEDVYLENEYPERVEINDGVQIGLRSTLIAHTRGPSRIVIERNAFIAANCVLAASPGKTLTIGEGAVLGVGSCVTNDVPAFMFYSVERAKPIAIVTKPLTIGTSYEQFVRGLRPLKKTR